MQKIELMIKNIAFHLMPGIKKKKKKFISLVMGSCRSGPSYMNLTVLTNIIHNRSFWPLSEQC